MLDRIAKPMFIRILMIILSALLAFISYLIIYILIGLRRVTGLDGLYPFFNIFKITPIFMILILIASVVVAVLGIHRYRRVKQDTYSLINAIVSILYIIILLINVSFFMKVGRIVPKDDIYSLKTLFNGQSLFGFRILFVLSSILVLYNLFILLLATKVIRLSIFIPDHIANTREVRVGNKVLTNTQAAGDETRLYLLSLSKKSFFKSVNGLIVLFTSAAIVITFFGYTLYDRYIVCDPVDLGSQIEINPNYNVESGKGKLLPAEISNKNTYKGKSKEAKAYIDALIDNPENYEISKQTHLKNGDEITVTVKYDEQRCDDLHIRVSNNKYTTKPLKGFIDEFKNGKAVADTKNVLATAKQTCDERMQAQYKGKKYTIKYDSAWLCKYQGNHNDAIVLIYRVENKGKVFYVDVYSYENIMTNYTDDFHGYIINPMVKDKKTVTTSKEARSLVREGHISDDLDQADQTYLID